MLENLSSSALYLSKIILTNFRNHKYKSIESNNKSVVITGNNGVGKTNILEAISLLCSGRGLRHAKNVDFLNINDPNLWSVYATIMTKQGLNNISTGIENKKTANFKGNEKYSRLVKINGEYKKQIEMDNYMSCIWLTPQMDRFFYDGSNIRRRFLDKLASSFDSQHNIRKKKYDKALKNRTILLKNANYDKKWMDLIEKDIALNGTAIAAFRLTVIKLLNKICEKSKNYFPALKINLIGEIENLIEKFSAREVQEIFLKMLCDNREKDSLLGRASIGIHKTDMQVIYLEKNMLAQLCSTGEQKLLLISMVLSQVQLELEQNSYLPILLLDEISSNLDKKNLELLFKNINDLGVQTWYTGTNVNDFSYIMDSVEKINL